MEHGTEHGTGRRRPDSVRRTPKRGATEPPATKAETKTEEKRRRKTEKNRQSQKNKK
jgi:hypothetical protein